MSNIKVTIPSTDQVIPTATGNQASDRTDSAAKDKKKRKPRPGKNARQKQKASLASADSGNWADDADADFMADHYKKKWENTRRPKGTKPPAKDKRFSDGGRPDFQPGKYPILFDATASDRDTDEFPLIEDWGKTIDASTQVFEIIKQTPSFESYCADIQLTDATQLERFELAFHSTAILSTVQSLVHTSIEQDIPVGDASFVLRADLPHLATIRAITNQAGRVDNQQVGSWYAFPDVQTQVEQGIRSAVQMSGVCPNRIRDEQRYAYVKASSWLPTKATGPHTVLREFLRGRLNQWMVSTGNDWVDIPSDLPILEGVNPPWLNPALHPNPNPFISLRFLFVACPTTEGDWVNWLNTIPNAWYVPSQTPPRPRGAWIAEDLSFNVDWGSAFEKLVSSWSIRMNNIYKYFHTLDKKALSRTGSAEQTSMVQNRKGLILYTGWSEGDVHSKSLAAIFPLTAWHNVRLRPREYRTTTTRFLQEARVKWVAGDVK